MTGPDIWADILNYDPIGYVEGMEIPEYLIKGFTITQWVRFRDKVNGGTLFNYGNPLRQIRPMGFKLESFVISETNPEYQNPDEELFFVENFNLFEQFLCKFYLRDSLKFIKCNF